MKKIAAVDFFCGCGGTSFGFKKAGIDVICGIDFDETCQLTYEKNLGRNKFVHADIAKLRTSEIKEKIVLKKGQKLLFSACAPCQPFSTYNKNKNKGDRRKSLLLEFARFIKDIKPDYIFIENVPGLQNVDSGRVFKKFIRQLENLKYSYQYKVINASDYGVPQSRKRLILLASKDGDLSFPEITHGLGKGLKPYATVRSAIGNLPELKHGLSHDKINGHFSRKLSDLNLARLRATPKNGGSRSDWPKKFVLECHKKSNGHNDVYGRMAWDKLAPVLTCNCTSISNGRFGHPEQDRAISPREAAMIQTFPKSFIFYGGLVSMSKHIGNAVPVKLAQVFGKAILGKQRS
jgi:DNA (cytosine-5)-methyltransferase 1